MTEQSTPTTGAIEPSAPSGAANGGNPWQQQPGEPDDLYRQFCTYRDAGPGRSVRSTFAAITGRPPSNMTGTWSRTALTWRWEARAKAWDAQRIGADLREPLRRELRVLVGEIIGVAMRQAGRTANDNQLLSDLARVVEWMGEVER